MYEYSNTIRGAVSYKLLKISRYFRSAFVKLSFLWITMSLNGILMLVLPFLSSFGLLVTVRAIQNIALGGYITADQSLLVYTMGPIKSRPFTNALHACVGIGFVAATFLVGTV